MTQAVRILGARVRATVAVDLVRWEFSDRVVIEGYYDDSLPVGSLGPGGAPVVGNIEDALTDLPGLGCLAFLALGTRTPTRTSQIFSSLKAAGVNFLSLISRGAAVSPSARIGLNALVFPGVFIGCEAAIGHLFCAHGGATVEHHGSIGHNVLMGPGATLAGMVQVGSHAFLGAGSSVVPEARIGPGTLIGAGSVVVGDLPGHVVAFGNPARTVRDARRGDEVPTREEIDKLVMAGLY